MLRPTNKQTESEQTVLFNESQNSAENFYFFASL